MAKLKDWVLDYVYWAKGVVVLRRKPPKHYKGSNKAESVPVILLSGLALKWHFLRHLGNRISYAGHPVYVIPNLRGNWTSIPEAAKAIRDVIEEHNLKRVVVVAHSKGGLIAKYVLVHHNNDDRIKSVIAVATPFSGSRLARAIPHRAVHELLPDSRIIQDLQKSTAANKKIISIIPEFDNHIWAEQGSNLDGARNVNVKVRGHHRVVFDKEVEDTILQALKEF